jgi:hypothetical protein
MGGQDEDAVLLGHGRIVDGLGTEALVPDPNLLDEGIVILDESALVGEPVDHGKRW